jgi:hypothetical protein
VVNNWWQIAHFGNFFPSKSSTKTSRKLTKVNVTDMLTLTFLLNWNVSTKTSCSSWPMQKHLKGKFYLFDKCLFIINIQKTSCSNKSTKKEFIINDNHLTNIEKLISKHNKTKWVTTFNSNYLNTSNIQKLTSKHNSIRRRYHF